MTSNNPNNPFDDPGEMPESLSGRGGQQQESNRQHQPFIAYGGEDATINPFAASATTHPPAPQQPQQPQPQYVGNADLIDLQQNQAPMTINTSYPPPLHTGQQQQFSPPGTGPAYTAGAPLGRVDTFNTDTGNYNA